MLYVCEFEFFRDDGCVLAVPCNGMGEGTFGDDLEDAVTSAADWLGGVVEDCLLGLGELPPMEFGYEPEHGGRIIAVAVERDLSDVPAMTATRAAEELGVSVARVSQLAKAGLLRGWKDGNRLMVSNDSVEARKRDAPKPGRPREKALA